MARALLAVGLLAFVLGAALVGAVAWRAGLTLDEVLGRAAEPVSDASPAPEPTPVASPTSRAESAFDARLALLEQRLARLNLQAAAASGNVARAEGLLIAFAARRAIERGGQLGFLEEQLKLRFADAQPNAVNTIIASAARPVTIDQLMRELQGMASDLAEAPREQSGWERLQHELSNLFVIRRDSSPRTPPEARIDRALMSLRQGRIENAITEVSRLPNAAGAEQWIDEARRYQATQRALDLIETTAILDTRRLRDAGGQNVEQPSPATAPPAEDIPDT